MKAIGGGRQVTIVAVLLELLLQGVHLLSQQHDLLLHVGDHLISLRKLLLQQTLFLSQVHHFFFGCHVPTVFGSGLLGKPSSTREWLHSSFVGVTRTSSSPLTALRLP